jgi:hypothetical protein
VDVGVDPPLETFAFQAHLRGDHAASRAQDADEFRAGLAPVIAMLCGLEHRDRTSLIGCASSRHMYGSPPATNIARIQPRRCSSSRMSTGIESMSHG